MNAAALLTRQCDRDRTRFGFPLRVRVGSRAARHPCVCMFTAASPTCSPSARWDKKNAPAVYVAVPPPGPPRFPSPATAAAGRGQASRGRRASGCAGSIPGARRRARCDCVVGEPHAFADGRDGGRVRGLIGRETCT